MNTNDGTANAEFMIQKICLELGEAEFLTAKKILSSGVTIETITELLKNAHWYIDLAAGKVGEMFHLPSPVCKRGCSYCCYGRVGVIAPEVVCLSRLLRESLATDEIANLLRCTQACAMQVRSLGSRERVAKHVACPLLLENNECLAYVARPIRCRGWNSLDATQCRSYWLDASVKQTPHSVALYDHITRHILGAIVGALRELQVRADQLELITALEIALIDSSVEERWLAGEDVFRDAIITEPSL
jgi:hypothetical protein